MLWITQEADVGSESSYLSHFLVTRGEIYALQTPLRQGKRGEVCTCSHVSHRSWMESMSSHRNM